MHSSDKSFKFDTARFHVLYGPAPLFLRIRYKMKDVNNLLLDIPHCQQRVAERDISKNVVNEIEHFDSSMWNLASATVRTDTGKFVSSSWTRVIDGRCISITIGLGNRVVTVYEKNSSGVEQCIRSGPLYDFVNSTNQKLMDDCKWGNHQKYSFIVILI